MTEQTSRFDKAHWRDLVAYWILGLCNNFGYVVMLTAAHDILAELEDKEDDKKSSLMQTFLPINDNEKRDCNLMSTGAVLLADILPALVVKYIAPFLPFMPFVRVAFCIVVAIAGFILVAYGNVLWVALFGIALTSLSSGLGEVTFLGYSSNYHKNVISTWSSGTGGAGVLGALSYSVLTQIGLGPKATLLVMISVPILEGIAFYFILLHYPSELEEVTQDKTTSTTNKEDENNTQTSSEDQPLVGFKEQLRYVPSLLKYILPLLLVYVFEYFINQGLFELIYFPDIWIDNKEQYRWFQVTYQIGVFISRSSVNIIKIRWLWIMAILQGINVVLFTFEAVYYFTPSIWIVLAFVLWEGLLGGGAYVNTFYRISEEVPASRKQFALSASAIADSTGIAIAGFLSMPAHNAICKLPLPSRLQ